MWKKLLFDAPVANGFVAGIRESNISGTVATGNVSRPEKTNGSGKSYEPIPNTRPASGKARRPGNRKNSRPP